MRASLLILVAAAAVGLGACRSTSDPAAEVERLRSQMCACTDAACATKLDPAVSAWTARHGTAVAAKPELQATVARVARCKEDASGDPVAREILEGLHGYHHRACACTDGPCAEAVETEQGQWLVDNQKRFAGVKSTKAQEVEANTIAAETEACARKALKAAKQLTPAPPTEPAPTTP